MVFNLKNYYILFRCFIYYYKVKIMEYKNKLYINGEWLDGANKESFDVINPATEEVITSVSSAEEPIIDKRSGPEPPKRVTPIGTLSLSVPLRLKGRVNFQKDVRFPLKVTMIGPSF